MALFSTLCLLTAVVQYAAGQGFIIDNGPNGEGRCLDPEGPLNGEVRWSRNSDRTEMSATYVCNEDFTLNGPIQRSCSFGDWTPREEPTCDLATPLPPACDPPKVPNNGNVAYSRVNGRPTKATYRCYLSVCTLIGASERNCVNGQWVPAEEPTCTCPTIQVRPTQPSSLDPCFPNPCSSQGDCISSGLIVNPSQRFTCICRNSYTGSLCEIPPVVSAPDPCFPSQCQNGGICSPSGASSYSCRCGRGYTGRNCEIFIDPCNGVQCRNGGTCDRDFSLVSGYRCRCAPAYTGPLCDSRIFSNPCAGVQCANGGTCNPSSTGFRCACAPAYTGRFCLQRITIDVNPCLSGSLCRNGGTCIRNRALSIGYSCRCPPSFTGQFCDRAVPVVGSDVLITPQGTLVMQQSEARALTCSYTGNQVENSISWTRQDGRQLTSGVFASNGQLIFFQPPTSASGVYVCRVLHSGGSSVSTTTVRIGGGPVAPNQCSPNPCRNGGRCSPDGQSYRCSCPPGFRGSECQVIPVPTQPPTQRPEPTRGPVLPTGPLQVTVSPSNAIRRVDSSTALFCQVSTVPSGYAITSTRWERTNGQALPFGRTQQYTGNTYLYIRNHQESDSGGYRCTVEATNAVGRTVQNSAAATITVTTISIAINPSSAERQVGDSLTLECDVEGVRNLEPRWRRQNSSVPFRSGRYLQLRNLQRRDSDLYYCEVEVSPNNVMKATSTITVGNLGEPGICIGDDGKTLQEGEYRYINGIETIREAKISPAADFIFLVDESGSMIQEHAWLERVSSGLDESLKKEGIGLNIPNQFCLIGFAHPPFEDGRVLPMPSGAVMGNAMEFDEARKALATDGRIEDMYAAMNLGFEKCELRPGMACQVIGVTDEGRSARINDNFQIMLEKLQSRGCILNVGVNEKMLSQGVGGSVTALGVSSRNDSAIETPGGNFEIVRGKGQAQAISGHGNTDEMYVQLAFKTGGAAWDLNELRKGGNTARAFTNAFIDLKVREISGQVCQLCSCEQGPVPTCTRGCLGEPPFVSADGPSEVPAGGDVEIICIPVGGVPVPELEYKPSDGQFQLPDKSNIREVGDTLIITVSDVREKFCIDCVGTNLEGEHIDQHCVDVLSEPPTVDLTGSNNGQPVPYGDPVSLTCVPLSGLPLPTLEITGGRGFQLPSGTTTVQVGNNTITSIPSLTEDVCIDCIGTNLAGTGSDQECLRVLRVPPDVDLTGSNNGRPVPHGSPVTLTCVPLAGQPEPTLRVEPSRGYRQPVGTTSRRVGSNIVLTIPSLTADVCFDCEGTSPVGQDVDQECLTILPEPPIVDLSGSNNGRPVPYGQPVTLTCVPVSGRPAPTLRLGPSPRSSRPAGTDIRTVGSNVVARIERLTEDVCFTCVGTSEAGRHTDEECLTVAAEPPIVDLTGSNNGQPINSGTPVTLRCVPLTGRPNPTLQVRPSVGYNLPSGTRATTNPDGSVTVTVPRLDTDTCFDCIGTNPVGRHTDQECISVLDSCPHPRGLDNVLHGGTIRNYTSREGETEIKVPGSAVIVFVIDESGSMRQEHEWLQQLPSTLERNLRRKRIGLNQPNQYALVGFGHPDPQGDPERERGKVLQECGPASDVQSVVNSGLYQDGRLEDGYSAVSVGLQQLSCMATINQRRQRGEKVACQVILVTDEGRDALTSWEYESMRSLLGSRECILNVAIWERFQGRRSASDAYSLALGVSYNKQAVVPVAPGLDAYNIVPDGKAVDQTGAENTHEKYVELAFATRGAAWDLEQLRSDQYRASFTNGFIEVKVQEIIRQIIGSCYNCRCDDGSWSCTEIGAVLGEFNCLFPQGGTSGGAINPLSGKFPCCNIGNPESDAEVKWFKEGESSAVQTGPSLTLNNAEQAGKYICLVSGAPLKYARMHITSSGEEFHREDINRCSYEN